MSMPASIQRLLARLRGDQQVAVVIQTTRGTQTVRVPLRDLRRR